jgi:hypothetical protein
MGKNYVFSTASTSIGFPEYSTAPKNGIPQIVRNVVIKGGANVPDIKTLVTPRGIATEVTDDQLAFLMGHKKFQSMVQSGFMTIASDKADMNAALRDMAPKDKSAPKTVDDYKEVLGKQPDGSETKITAGAATAAA